MDDNKKYYKMIINKVVVSLLVFSGVILTAFNSSNNIEGKVVCFGDSITYGAKVNRQSWVYYLSKEHKDLHFVNAGRKGRKTSDTTEILPVLKENPNADYFLIFLGVNDLKDGNDSMVNNCVKNMQWLVDRVQETSSKTKTVILSPTDINLKTMAPVNVKKRYNEDTKNSLIRLEEKYKELAGKNSLGFISLLHTVSPANYVDGLHPNRDGQREIARAVWKGLQTLK